MTLKAAVDVGGRYHLERRIGRGAMGEVWLATDERLDRSVALKFLGASFDDGRDFERETGILSGLRHPNIVTVYDAGEEDDRRFIVMEWVEGRSLRERLQQGGVIPLAEAAPIGAAIASALAYAHERRIVHNDIKPENILLDATNDPRLTDFGVARVTGNTMAPGEAEEMLGTIAYVAPEVLQGAPADARSDIYALATTLYESISGRLPFEAASNTALAGQKLSGSPRPLSDLVPDAPDGLTSTVMAGLAFAPADRPDATEFARALRAVPPDEVPATAPLAAMLASTAPRPTTRIQPVAAARRAPPNMRKALLAAMIGGFALIALGALALSRAEGGSGFTPSGTPTPGSELASANETAATAPAAPTEQAQQAATPVANNGNDDKDDKDDKPKPGRGRGR